MQSGFGFSGHLSKASYGVFTLLFAAIVFGLAETQSNAPFTQLMAAPWLVIGRALDDLIQIGGDRASIADTAVSMAVGIPLVWAFLVMTARRLRDIGQSPWWSLLVIFSGVVVPTMIALSLFPSKPSTGQVKADSQTIVDGSTS